MVKMDFTRALDSVNKTIVHQSNALNNLRLQFQEDEFSQVELQKSIRIMFQTIQFNGKIVLCGIGKSFKIANKLVATLNSLSLYSSVLHPLEALHGDLGLINENRDCLVFVTASGNTPELLQLLPHILDNVPIILLTCNKVSKLSQHPKINALMYAQLADDLNEDSIHGLPAPTVLATLLLVLADAAILSLLELIVDDLNDRRRQFSLKHPGGSIGANLSHLNSRARKDSSTSLLSLNQIRHTLDVGSLTSSDDESEFKARKSPSSLQTSKAEVDLMVASKDTLKLLTWATMYDLIEIETNLGVKNVCTLHMKELYKSHLAGTPNWEAFSKGLYGSLD